MKVLMVNTSELTGGAAIAAKRLMTALNKNGVKARMLVRDKQSNNLNVLPLPKSIWHKVRFISERGLIFLANGCTKKHLFDIDTAWCGVDITQLTEFQEADIIHLHWVNQGMLSMKDLNAIFKSGKPVVWTLHDTWPFTGICHYIGQCEHFKEACGHCPLLRFSGRNDMSAAAFAHKAKIYTGSRLRMVGCSEWIMRLAQDSKLTEGLVVEHIPNALNTTLFTPHANLETRKKRGIPVNKYVLLFGAMKITDKRKGVEYVPELCRYLQKHYPQVAENTVVALFGNATEALIQKIPLPTIELGYVNNESELADIYAAADVFVIPSLADNLPNTVVEALSCGTPCVGFQVGGVPEMIIHKQNGYIAPLGSAEELAKGVAWTLEHKDELHDAARQWALNHCSEHKVAARYTALYERMLSHKTLIK